MRHVPARLRRMSTRGGTRHGARCMCGAAQRARRGGHARDARPLDNARARRPLHISQKQCARSARLPATTSCEHPVPHPFDALMRTPHPICAVRSPPSHCTLHCAYTTMATSNKQTDAPQHDASVKGPAPIPATTEVRSGPILGWPFGLPPITGACRHRDTRSSSSHISTQRRRAGAPNPSSPSAQTRWRLPARC